MNENNNGLIGSFIAGALLGAGLALLLAPAEGRETRRRLKGQLQNVRDIAGNGIDKARHMVGEKARHVRDGVRDGVREGMDAFQHATDEPGAGGSRG